MDNNIWEIFKSTGDIRYYLLLKEMESSVKDENRKSERNNI